MSGVRSVTAVHQSTVSRTCTLAHAQEKKRLKKEKKAAREGGSCGCWRWQCIGVGRTATRTRASGQWKRTFGRPHYGA